jgi:hypothetical protein
MKARLPCRGRPRTDTKITVGFGLEAADTESGIISCTALCAVLSRCGGGIWRDSQALPVNRTMPGKRVLPTVAQKFQDDYAEGLGRYWTGFPLEKKEVKCRQLSSRTRERLTTKQFSAG